MSGGTYGFGTYKQIEEYLATLKDGTAQRRAFKAHLVCVAQAMRAIEWVDRGDWEPGQEDPIIEECLRTGAVLATVMKEAEGVTIALQQAVSSLQRQIRFADISVGS